MLYWEIDQKGCERFLRRLGTYIRSDYETNDDLYIYCHVKFIGIVAMLRVENNKVIY